MEDRKLYHLINGEFVHDGMPSMRIPTYEEVATHIAILQNVGFFDEPIAESVTFAGLGTGKRSDAVQASVFDMIHAEILGEHNAEKARVRNRRKADRKAKRKSGAYVKRNGGDWRKDEHYAGDGRMWHDYVGWEHTKSQIGGKIRERSLRKDFRVELCQHEDAMAEYFSLLDWKAWHEKAKEELLDTDIHTVSTDGLYNGIAYENARIEQLDTEAKNILKGECY